MKRSMLSAAILVLGLGATSSALAVNYAVELCAGSFVKDLTPQDGDMTDGNTAVMWGYAMGGRTGSGANATCINTPSSPGPIIVVPDANDGLEITLHNTLPRPTSLVIPGTVKAMSPIFFKPITDNTTTPVTREAIGRVRSFDSEALRGGAGTPAVYSWNNLSPGSYMYHSGTHPQVQMQMGLYGAVIDDVVSGSEAYPGKSYTQDIVLFYTEIDKVIHEGVAAGGYSFLNAAAGSAGYMQSTIDYDAKYFFVDVDETYIAGDMTYEPGTFEFNDLPTIKLSPGTDSVLVRFFNASPGLHVPTVFDADFDIIAEDGKLYPNVRTQYSVELPALKTKDAFLNIYGPPPGGTSFRLTDSAMAVSNPAPSAGPVVALDASTEIANGDNNGMVLNIEVAAATGYVAVAPSSEAPVAREDRMTVLEGGLIDSVQALVLSNDTNGGQASLDILTYPKQGELIADSGGYRYQHDAGEVAQDSFVYELTNAGGETSAAGVVIDVMPVNDPPVANDDTVATQVGKLVEIRALHNDTDVDSESIVITGVDTSELGSLTANDQVIVFEPTQEGSEDVSYSIADSSGAAASAVLHLSVAAAAVPDSGTFGGGSTGGGSVGSGDPAGVAPEATEDVYTVIRGQVLDTTTSIIVGVMANDSQGAKVNPTLVRYPEHGAIEIFENGTFIYAHDGSKGRRDDFEYEIYNDHGSSTAEVKIQVKRN